MLRRGTLVLIVALVFGTSGVASSATSTSSATTTNASVTRVASLEALLVREINVVRASHGLRRLTRSSPLTRTAVGHSVAMATRGFFTHESQDGTPFWQRVKQVYVPQTHGWTVGENLAMFGGSPPTATDIVAAWMASPPHRANLLRGLFREAGVGVVYNPVADGVFGGLPTWVVTLDVGRR
jgi:uncharacterized protein YkwD